MTVYRATANGVGTASGGLLASGDPYRPELTSDGGFVHPSDASHVAEGRLLVLDDAEPSSTPARNKAPRGKEA